MNKAALVAALAAHPFRPPPWARPGLVQTSLAAFGGRAPAPTLALERLGTPDGDFVRLHVAAGGPTRPLVLVLHGLEGDRDSRYVRELARRLEPANWRLAVLEFRSCGGEPNQLARSYHSGETQDLAFVVAHLLARHPDVPLFAVGFSLGGNVLLKWLGELGDAAPARLVGAAAVSTPFDLGVAARQCDARYGGAIARHFLRTLIPKALAKAARFPQLLDAPAIRRCRSFTAFDDLVTAPLHGFVDAADYWRRSSSAGFVAAIRRPTLLLNAIDDPLVPASVLPRAAAAASPFLVPLFPAHGGHVGFVDGGPLWSPRRWAEARVAQFFALLHDAGHGVAPATATSS
jgi:predicted alpha/beta-fold hydrolase